MSYLEEFGVIAKWRLWSQSDSVSGRVNVGTLSTRGLLGAATWVLASKAAWKRKMMFSDSFRICLFIYLFIVYYLLVLVLFKY